MVTLGRCPPCCPPRFRIPTDLDFSTPRLTLVSWHHKIMTGRCWDELVPQPKDWAIQGGDENIGGTLTSEVKRKEWPTGNDGLTEDDGREEERNEREMSHLTLVHYKSFWWASTFRCAAYLKVWFKRFWWLSGRRNAAISALENPSAQAAGGAWNMNVLERA